MGVAAVAAAEAVYSAGEAVYSAGEAVYWLHPEGCNL
jgi:hypothetical protein